MTNELQERFKECYRNLLETDLSQLGELYADEVVFRDPVHQIHGLVKLEDYFTALCEDLNVCRFEYLDEAVSDNSAYIKWIMHFEHAKLGQKTISVRGVSHLQFIDKVTFHEDFYDMGAMLYEQVPVLGGLTKWLRCRLAAA